MLAYDEAGWPPDITASWIVWANSAWNTLSQEELSVYCPSFYPLVSIEGTYVLRVT